MELNLEDFGVAILVFDQKLDFYLVTYYVADLETIKW